MNIGLATNALIVASAIALFVSALVCYSRVSRAKLLSILISTAMFFLLWVARDIIDQSVKPAAILLFVWLYVLVFYFFGIRYASGRGLSQSVSHKEAVELMSSRQEHVVLGRALLMSKHLLLWPMIALLVFILARGMMGYGWVTTLS